MPLYLIKVALVKDDDESAVRAAEDYIRAPSATPALKPFIDLMWSLTHNGNARKNP